MLAEVNPDQLKIHDVLRDTHPLGIDEFNLLQRGDISEDSLTQAQKRELEHARTLGKSIRESGQENPIKVAMGQEARWTLVQGYDRYLGTRLEDIPPEMEEVEYSSPEAVALHSLNENENRWPSDPEGRAVALAIALGAWNPDTQAYEPDYGEGRTIQEVADRLGRSRMTIYRWLSPIRQHELVREIFADYLSETILQRIESVTENDTDQFLLTQATVQSREVSTLADFRDVMGGVRDRLEGDVSKDELVDALHDRLRNGPPVDESDAAPSTDATPTAQGAEATEEDSEESAAAAIKRREWQERQEFSKIRQETDPATASRTARETPEIERPTTGEPTQTNGGGGGRQSTLGEYTVSFEEPALEDAIAQVAEEHGITPEEAIVQIVRTHFREQGTLDTPVLSA